jgi:hypothetical protein
MNQLPCFSGVAWTLSYTLLERTNGYRTRHPKTETAADHPRDFRGSGHLARHPRPEPAQARGAVGRQGNPVDRFRQARRNAARGPGNRNTPARSGALDSRGDGGARGAHPRLSRNRGEAGHRDPRALQPGRRAGLRGRRAAAQERGSRFRQPAREHRGKTDGPAVDARLAGGGLQPGLAGSRDE